MNPLFSIVVPIYNKRPHISRALTSVLHQTLEDFELLLIDDASTDGSDAEIERYNDPRIRRLSRALPGPGGYAARNLGIQEAHSARIVFLDADDEWYPDHLGELDRLYRFVPHGVLFGTGYIDSGAGGLDQVPDAYTRSSKRNDTGLVTLEDYARALAAGRGAFRTSAVSAPRSALLDVGGFPAGRCIRGGDLDTWVRLLDRGVGVRSTALTAIYHRDSENMVTKTTKGFEGPPCLEPTISALLERRSDRTLRLVLSTVQQHLQRMRLTRLSRRRQLRWGDVAGLSPFREPLFYLAVLCVVLFPTTLGSAVRSGRRPLGPILRKLIRAPYR